MNSKCSVGPVLPWSDNGLSCVEIKSEDMLVQVIGFIKAHASESPWLDDPSLTEVLRECKKISIPKHTKWSHGISFTLGEILLNNIRCEFEKLANLKWRVKVIAECYKGPVELKEKWIELRFKELLPVQQSSVSRRIQFCSYLFHLFMISRSCIISLMEHLISVRNDSLQKFSFKCLYDLIHSLIEERQYYPHNYIFCVRTSVRNRMSDILDIMRGSHKGDVKNAKNIVSISDIRNLIRNIKLELGDDEIAKVRQEAKKQNQLRLIEEKRNQLRLENEKKRILALSQGQLRFVDEIEEKDFDSAMIVDLFN